MYIYIRLKKSNQNKTKQKDTPPQKKTHQPTNPLEDQKFTKMSSHAKGKKLILRQLRRILRFISLT